MGRIVERVAKLQRLATSPNPNEAHAAAEQALRLMREHAISQADVDAALLAVEDPMIARKLYLSGLSLVDYADRKERVHWVAGWKRSLADAVGSYLGLRCSYVSGTPIFTLYGHASDVAMAVALYATCARQIDWECAAWLREEKKRIEASNRWWSTQDGRDGGFRFRESAVRGLASKLQELTEESMQDHAEGHTLVLSRKASVSSWVDATYTFAKGDGSGFGGKVGFSGAGYAAGKKLRLTPDVGIEGKASRRLGGA